MPLAPGGRHARLLLVTVAIFALIGGACTSSPGGSASAATAGGTSTPTRPSFSPTPRSASPLTSATPSASPQPDPSTPAPSGTPVIAEPAGWAPIDAAGPAAREDHTWTAGDDGSTWLFGGRDGATAYDDLWRYDLAGDSWEQVALSGPAPDARFGHTATWVDGSGLVVWSGQADATTFFDDLWAFDPAAGAWRELAAEGPVPAAR